MAALKEYNKNFIDGLNIISKYIPDDSDFDYHFEHDQIYFGKFEWVDNQFDIDKLQKLGWFKDSGFWCKSS